MPKSISKASQEHPNTMQRVPREVPSTSQKLLWIPALPSEPPSLRASSLEDGGPAAEQLNRLKLICSLAHEASAEFCSVSYVVGLLTGPSNAAKGLQVQQNHFDSDANQHAVCPRVRAGCGLAVSHGLQSCNWKQALMRAASCGYFVYVGHSDAT